MHSRLLMVFIFWLSISDFSNVISKSDVKVLAEADEQEVVREIQVSLNFSNCPYMICSNNLHIHVAGILLRLRCCAFPPVRIEPDANLSRFSMGTWIGVAASHARLGQRPIGVEEESRSSLSELIGALPTIGREPKGKIVLFWLYT